MIFTKWKCGKTPTNPENIQDCVRSIIRNGIFFIRFTSEKASDFDIILMISMAWLSCKINHSREMKIWKNTDEWQKNAPLCPFHHQKWHLFITFTCEKESEFDVILMVFMAWLSWKITDFHGMKIWKNTDESQKHAGLCPFVHQKLRFFSLDLHVERGVILMSF